MAAVGADTGVEFQVFEIDDLTTFRTFTPQTIAFIRFLLDVGDVLTLAAISKPIEEANNASTPSNTNQSQLYHAFQPGRG